MTQLEIKRHTTYWLAQSALVTLLLFAFIQTYCPAYSENIKPRTIYQNTNRLLSIYEQYMSVSSKMADSLLLLRQSRESESKGNLLSAEIQAKQASKFIPLGSTKSLFAAVVLLHEAKLLGKQTNFSESEELADQAAKFVNPSDDHNVYVNALSIKLLALAAKGQDEQALTVLKLLSVDSSNTSEAELNKQLSNIYAQLGYVYEEANDKSSATASYEKALRIYQTWCKRTSVPKGADVMIVPSNELIYAQQRLGELYIQSGRVEEGQKLQATAGAGLKFKQE
ncbi:MAG: hypothetical protein K2X29_02910 [Candidatus Obscuribacterales bacterium]|nr:hypothetical protein [Candidatus Obscuribacterales bacterium]